MRDTLWLLKFGAMGEGEGNFCLGVAISRSQKDQKNGKHEWRIFEAKFPAKRNGKKIKFWKRQLGPMA